MLRLQAHDVWDIITLYYGGETAPFAIRDAACYRTQSVLAPQFLKNIPLGSSLLGTAKLCLRGVVL